MSMKGTGWVPDFPNVKDYTLKSKQVKNLTSRVQASQQTDSIEELRQQFSQVLKTLKSETKDGVTVKNYPSGDPPLEASKELEDIIEDLNNKASKGIYFVDALVHKVLEAGMSGKEILKIKSHLKLLYPTECTDLDKTDRVNYIDPYFDKPSNYSG
ncbi:MAG: hypothetical protein AAGA75_23445 [Cyanobacteria bacterium P01_E01_bin.6]